MKASDKLTFLLYVVFWASITLGGLGLLLLLIFLPLGLSLAEHAVFHTHHVEDWFRAIGLHDELGRVYELVLAWFR